MADGEEAFRPQQAFAVGMGVHVADIGNVVTCLLHPEGQRELPQQKLARALRQRRIDDLPVFAIGPIPAGADTGAGVPVVGARRRAVIVQRPGAGPAIVRRPRRIAALKEKIACPVIAHDEDKITLQSLVLAREFPQVNTAHPV